MRLVAHEDLVGKPHGEIIMSESKVTAAALRAAHLERAQMAKQVALLRAWVDQALERHLEDLRQDKARPFEPVVLHPRTSEVELIRNTDQRGLVALVNQLRTEGFLADYAFRGEFDFLDDDGQRQHLADVCELTIRTS